MSFGAFAIFCWNITGKILIAHFFNPTSTVAGQDEDSLLLMKTLLTKRISWAFYYIAGHQGLNYYFPEAAFIGTDTTNDTLVL